MPQANQALPGRPLKKGFRAPLTLDLRIPAPTEAEKAALGAARRKLESET